MRFYLMVLMAKNVGPGDAVLCPSFTFCATGEVVALVGATPVFVDVDEATFNMDVNSLQRGIATARQRGLKPRAVIPVDLFGQSADHDAIGAVAEAEGLFVLDDAAQGFGASYKGRRLGAFGLATATSFFPAKPLGCFGDGGAIFTDDDKLAETLRSIRVHGQGSDKYDNVRLGLTGRLDTIQAAVLIEKLKIFEDEIAARNQVAERYARGLGNLVTVPRLASGCTSVWAQYTIRLPEGTDRDGFAAALKTQIRPRSTIRNRCISRRRIGTTRSLMAACRQAKGSRMTSSACRCMLTSTSRRRSGSSRLCAARFLPDFAVLQRAWRFRAKWMPVRVKKTHQNKVGASVLMQSEPMCAKSGACSDASSPSAATPCFRG